MQSQLRWADHVIRMGDERNPSAVMHSRLDCGHGNVGQTKALEMRKQSKQGEVHDWNVMTRFV